MEARIPSVHSNTEAQARKEALRDFEDNAARVDPPVLKVDRACMACAENKAQTLNAIKIACLTHTQSAIPY